MVIFHSYVKLPEGNRSFQQNRVDVTWVISIKVMLNIPEKPCFCCALNKSVVPRQSLFFTAWQQESKRKKLEDCFIPASITSHICTWTDLDDLQHQNLPQNSVNSAHEKIIDPPIFKVPIPKEIWPVNHCQPLIGSCPILALHSLHCHGCRTRSLEMPHTAGAVPRQLEETLSCGWKKSCTSWWFIHVYPISHHHCFIVAKSYQLPTGAGFLPSTIFLENSSLGSDWFENTYRLPSGKLRVCYWKWPLK